METVRGMRGVLGGFRNMLRQWRMNYLRNKKKKQREIEEGKLAKYYTLKRVAYSGLALMYYPISLFHTPAKKITKEYPDLVKIQQDILSAQKKMSKVSPKQKEKEIVKLEKKLIAVEKKITKNLIQKEETVKAEVEQTLQQVKRQLAILKKPMVINTSQVSIEPNNVISEQENVIFTDSSKQNKNQKGMKVTFESISLEPSLNRAVNQPQTFIENKVGMSLKKNIEKEEVKKWRNELEILAYKISTTKEYNLFYEFEKRLKECKKKLEEMRDSLEKDNFHQILSDMETKERRKPIIELLEQVQVLEKNMTERKKQIYFCKKENAIEKTKVVKKEQQKEERKKPKESVVSEWEHAQRLIMRQIEQQQKLLEEFEKKKIKNGKEGLFKTLSSLANNAITFLISMAPMAFFKNKLLGTFVTTIMINNSLKSMRRILNSQAEVSYEWLGQELKEKQSILENIYRISSDSLYQIATMKEEIMFLLQENPQNIEVLSFLKQIEVIEQQTLLVNERVKIEGKILDRQYTKIFTKGA